MAKPRFDYPEGMEPIGILMELAAANSTLAAFEISGQRVDPQNGDRIIHARHHIASAMDLAKRMHRKSVEALQRDGVGVITTLKVMGHDPAK